MNAMHFRLPVKENMRSIDTTVCPFWIEIVKYCGNCTKNVVIDVAESVGPYKGVTSLQKLGESESGEARIEGVKRLRFEGEAPIKGKA